MRELTVDNDSEFAELAMEQAPPMTGLATSDELRHLRNYPQPHPMFLKTRIYENAKDNILKGTKVLYIYGMSGGGKSQTALSVCKYLEVKRPDFLIWHVQCRQNGRDVIAAWKALLRKVLLYLPSVISIKEVDDICYELKRGQTKSFVHKLNTIRNPVLLVVEDMAEEKEKDLMRDIINQLQSPAVQVQLLVVTQKEEALYISEVCKKLEEYVPMKVKGFEPNEAVEFLGKDDEVSKMLAEELAYSPLRLFLAKVFCDRFEISYRSYYDGLGKDADIIAKEKEILCDHPELGKHTYEIIMKILDRKDKQPNELRVVKMMSFLDNNSIPDILLGAFFNEDREFETVAKEHRKVMYFLKRLEEDIHLTKRAPIGDSEEYGQATASVHNDILSAIRLSMGPAERHEILLRVLRCVTGVMRKENRRRKSNRLLCEMNHHVRKVVNYAELLKKNNDFSKPELRDFDLEVALCLIRLYEVLGFASTQTSGQTNDEYFNKAIDGLWKLACHYSDETQRDRSVFNELHFESTKNPAEVSRRVHDILHEANAKMPIDLIVKTCGRFFPMTESILHGIRAKLNDKRVDFSQMEKDMKNRRQLEEEHIKVLRDHEAILHPEKLRGVFLTEWMASILYSRGRQFFYVKDSVNQEELQRYEWHADVGLELCRCMSRDTGIKTIFEFIIQLNVKVPHLLHSSKERETDSEVWSRIRKCRKMACDLKNVDGAFYEHGIYKRVPGTPYTNMIILKYLVKANTKLYKRPELAKHHPIPTAIKECEELYCIAKEISSEFVISSNCMIHAGKYYAAIKKYSKAMQAFEDGFEFNGHGINSVLETKTNSYTWALYNYGRALFSSGGIVENFSQFLKRFHQRYDAVLPYASRNWREHLDEIKSRLQTLTSGSL